MYKILIYADNISLGFKIFLFLAQNQERFCDYLCIWVFAGLLGLFQEYSSSLDGRVAIGLAYFIICSTIFRSSNRLDLQFLAPFLGKLF